MQQNGGTTAGTAGTGAADVHKSIYRASLLLMGSYFLSRIIGFFREWVIAQTVGATAMTDVYLTSFTIPDFLNYLVAAGALSISFIPMLTAYISAGQEELGKLVFRSLTSIMGGLILILLVFAEIFAGHLAPLIAPGFSATQLAILTKLIRIILPAQFFFYWGGLAISVQQSYGKFWTTALAPILYNSCIILFGILLFNRVGVAGFSIGVLVGAILSQGILQWWGIYRLGYPVRPNFSLTPEIRSALKRYLWLTFPIMLGFSLVVTDEWISKYFASYLQKGAISWLTFARTEMRIPIAVIGQVAGVASFPYLSRLWSSEQYEKYAATLFREIQKLWAAAPVAAILMVVHALPLSHFIYGGGRLKPIDYHNIAAALQMFGIGIFFWTVQVLLSRGFYACSRTWLPSIVGTTLSVMAIPLYQYLARAMSFQGLALAGTIGITIYCTVLWFLLRRHLLTFCPTLSFAKLYRFCGLWVGVLALMGAIAYATLHLGLYRGTRLTALLDVLVTALVLSGLSIGLLRTVFAKMTDGPLF